MERNTLTTLKELKIGDRFYVAGDKKKRVLQKEQKSKTFLSAYPNFEYAIRADEKSGWKESKRFDDDTQVIFLRNTFES